MFSLHIRCVLGVAFFLLAGVGYGQSTSVGVSFFLTDSDEAHERRLALTLWYPSDVKDATKSVGANAVFLGAEGIADAQPRLGSWPLVLVSHGGLRSAKNSGAWFAQRMAREGYLAIEVNAPRVESPVNAVNELWLRPSDMTQALDALLDHPDWSHLIDQARLSSVGFYLGGTASLMLSGTPVDETAVRSSCDDGSLSPDCEWFAANGISLSADHLKPMPLDLIDERLSSFIAIAPEYLQVFSKHLPLAEQNHAKIILLGQQNGTMASYRGVKHIDQANQFDAFGHCTPQGSLIIKEEGGSPQLCDETFMRRQHIHDTIVSRVLVMTEAAGDEDVD